MAATNLSFLPDQTAPNRQPNSAYLTPESNPYEQSQNAATEAIGGRPSDHRQLRDGGLLQGAPFERPGTGPTPATTNAILENGSPVAVSADAGEYAGQKTRAELKRSENEQRVSLTPKVTLLPRAGTRTEVAAAARLGLSPVLHTADGVLATNSRGGLFLVHTHPHVHYLNNVREDGTVDMDERTYANQGFDCPACRAANASNGLVGAAQPVPATGLDAPGIGPPYANGGVGNNSFPQGEGATLQVEAVESVVEDIEARPNRSRSMSQAQQEDFLKASSWRIAAEIAIPFLIAGLGMVCAGLLLDYYTDVCYDFN